MAAFSLAESRRLAVRAFHQVQAIPYRTDGTKGSGNCETKARLLQERLQALGHECRIVRWRYRLPDLPPGALPKNVLPIDVHTALRVRRGSQWQLVDPTFDPALGRLGLPIASWDGVCSTLPAFEPLGPVLAEVEDQAAIELALREVAEAWAGAAASDVLAYTRRFNLWLESARSASS